MLRKVLGRNGILIEAEDVGGSSSRTVHWDVATGRFTIKSRGQETELQAWSKVLSIVSVSFSHYRTPH